MKPKTPLRARVLRSLSDVNDQMCFFLFLEAEFWGQLKSRPTVPPDAFTDSVFTANVYAPKIHVRIGDLPTFQRAHRPFALGSFVATSHEIVAGFLEAVPNLLARCMGAPAGAARKTLPVPEDEFRAELSEYGLPDPPSYFLDTLAFIRHRRNAFVHLHSAPSTSFKIFVRKSGTSLNAQWAHTATPVDFSTPTVAPISEPEAITLVKLLRICTEGIDTHIGAHIPVARVADAVAQDRFGHLRTTPNPQVVSQRMRLVKVLVERDYGLACPDADAERVSTTVGVS